MEFSYDANGNLSQKTQTIANQRFTTTYTYDEYDRMTTQTYPSGKVVGYEYDDKGELISMSIDGVPFIKNIKTNDNGLQSYEYADGSTHTREYDTNGRVTKLIYPNYTEEVNYNQVSNITAITADSIKKSFGFDNLDRLTAYDNNQTNAFQKFSYDENGNRLTQNQETNKTRRFSYTENSNILTGIKYYHTIDENTTNITKDINYTYDATGNIIKDEKHTYSYDSRNRLIAIDNNVTYQYNYDKRVSKTVNGVKTYFIYDGHMLIGDYKLNLSNNSRQEYIYLNSTPIATMTPTKTYRVYADHLDTSRRVATNDSNAEIVWKWESKPFGESKASGTINFNLRFPGQYYDNETGTHYNINRDYNPVTGRYIQSDPIGFDGGVNGFGYTSQNPLNTYDSSGLYTVYWGGAGLNGPYISDQVSALYGAGIRNIQIGTNASTGEITDGLRTNMLRYETYMGAWYDFDMQTECYWNEQHNYIGYSYGSLLAAHTANYKAKHTNCIIDNLVLIGSPIDNDFLNSILNEPWIENVHIINLTQHGDPLYAGMNSMSFVFSAFKLAYQQRQSGGVGHFYYAANDATGRKRRRALANSLYNRGLR